jgi:hypothetical protein
MLSLAVIEVALWLADNPICLLPLLWWASLTFASSAALRLYDERL